MKTRALIAAVSSLAMIAFVPAAAQAGTIRAQYCDPYPLGYNIIANSSEISVTISYPCPGEAQTWLTLQRSNGDGGWNYVTDDNSPGPNLYYACKGTAENTYQLIPLFTGTTGYTTDTFTDDCG